MKQISTLNPTTEEVCGTYPLMSQDDIKHIIEEMSRQQVSWSQTDVGRRQEGFLKVAKILRDETHHYASIITTEMGKPITQAAQEIEKCALLCDYYAKMGATFLEDEIIETSFYKTYRSFQPLGIIFAIMPWNYPFWQVMRFAVPNLMVGNAGLLKHAPNCIGTSLAIEQLFIKAGFPKGLFRSLVADVDVVPFIIQHPKICGVTLTGSNRAGIAVGEESGRAMKKVVLELGGSDPYVILKDADIENAASECVSSRLGNCGQVCIAAKRMIVVKEVKEAFEALVLAKAKKYVMGNPTDPNTNLGPMAREDLRANLHEQVLRSISKGARCVLGGSIPSGKGFFYPATVLFDVDEDSPAFHEELFGPVICVTVADDEAHALRLANQTEFGLAAAVFTSDLKKGEHIAKKVLMAGGCAVNTHVASDPRLPFGGIKQSGYGRELSLEGMREFVNIKTVIVAKV